LQGWASIRRSSNYVVCTTQDRPRYANANGFR
jgi:hypothetical protein